VRRAAALIVLLAVAGCGSGSGDAPSTVTVTETTGGDGGTPATPAAVEADAAVAGDGFQQVDDTAFYGVVLQNPSQAEEAREIKVLVRGLDAKDKVVGSDTAEFGAIPPGVEVSIGGQFDLDGGAEVKRIEVKARTGEVGQPTVLLPRVTGVRLVQEAYGGLTVHGEVENVLDQKLSTVADVFAVFRDGQGSIIGGTSAPLPHDVPPGERAPIELMVDADLRGAVRADVTVDNQLGR
jgi:hypothetical protein